MIEEYLDRVERWIAGPKARKAQVRAEIEAHLRGAEASGDVQGAISRLGDPREAARAFSEGHSLAIASLPRRIGAALIDLVVFGALLTAAGGLIALVGANNVNDQANPNVVANVFAGVAMVGALLWWALGLTLVEWKTGRTPGKALVGLRVVAVSGTAPSFGQILLRRLTLIFSGPLQIIDWCFVFFNPKHQRAFDILAHTLVVEDPRNGAMAAVPST